MQSEPAYRRWGFSISIFIATSIIVAYAWYLLTATVSQYEVIFKDFGTKLPASTMMLLDVSRWMRTPAGYLIFLIPLLPAVLIPRMGRRGVEANDLAAVMRQLRWVTLLLFVLVMLLGLQILAGAALMQPMNSLIQNISSPGTHL